jgi:hypothetical protein
MSFVLAALAIALVAAVLGLAREVRLRKALQRIVRLLLQHLRRSHESTIADANDLGRNPRDVAGRDSRLS